MTSLATTLGAYDTALNRRDASRLTSFYADHFMHVSHCDEGFAHAWRRNNEEFRAGLERALHFYAALGAARFKIASVTESLPQPTHALASVSWRAVRSDGSELVTLEVSYLIRTRHTEPRIVAFINHDEEGRLLAQGLPAKTDGLLFSLPNQHAQERQRASVSGRIHTYELLAVPDRRGAAGGGAAQVPAHWTWS